MAPKLKPLPSPPGVEPVQRGWNIPPLEASPARQGWPHLLVFWGVWADPQDDGSFTFATAHARLYVRSGDPGEHTYEPQAEALVESPEALWDTIDGWTRYNRSMRLYAQDHAFALGLCDALGELTDRGYAFEPGKDMIWSDSDEGVPYLRMRRGNRRPLTFIDTRGLYHHGIRKIGQDVGLGERPGADTPAERCMWDTAVLAEATLRYLERFRELGVRPDGLTGASNGFHLLRTCYLAPGRVHHHRSEELHAVEGETRKIGGRREAWRHGAVEGPLYEWDYANTHATICLEPVPSRPRLAGEGPRFSGAGVTHLQEWIVTTDVPCVPYRDERRGTVYPVGRFPATLWGPESALVLDHGGKLEPYGRRWEYELRDAMRPWAEWVIDALHNDDDPIWRYACKAWSRSVIGKWGQTNTRYEPTRRSRAAHLQDGFTITHCIGHPDGYRRVLYTGLGAWGIRDDAGPSDNSNYAILSWVQAQTRIMLWRAMVTAGPENVVSVNTDGLIVTGAGNRRLDRAAIAGLKPKRTYRHGVDVRNAQGLIDLAPNPRHKISGMPTSAIRVGQEATWNADVWHRSLVDGPSMFSGTWTLLDGSLGRTRAPGGLTRPYRVAK